MSLCLSHQEPLEGSDLITTSCCCPHSWSQGFPPPPPRLFPVPPCLKQLPLPPSLRESGQAAPCRNFPRTPSPRRHGSLRALPSTGCARRCLAITRSPAGTHGCPPPPPAPLPATAFSCPHVSSLPTSVPSSGECGPALNEPVGPPWRRELPRARPLRGVAAGTPEDLGTVRRDRGHQGGRTEQAPGKGQVRQVRPSEQWHSMSPTGLGTAPRPTGLAPPPWRLPGTLGASVSPPGG